MAELRGIPPGDAFLVFVDYFGKGDLDRPDFYILTATERRDVVEDVMRGYVVKYGGHRRARITDENVLELLDEVGPSGKPYQGVGVSLEHIAAHREAWQKITGVQS